MRIQTALRMRNPHSALRNESDRHLRAECGRRGRHAARRARRTGDRRPLERRQIDFDQRPRPAAAGTDERGARKDAARERLSHRARRRATLLPGGSARIRVRRRWTRRGPRVRGTDAGDFRAGGPGRAGWAGGENQPTSPTRPTRPTCARNCRTPYPIPKPTPCRRIALEAGMPGIDEEQGAEPILPLLPEVHAGHFFKRVRRLAPAACESISRQIDNVEGRSAPAPDAIEIRQPCLAWCRAGASDSLADERVNQARFADIRAADQRQLGKPVVRPAGRVRDTPDEGGGNLQIADCARRIADLLRHFSIRNPQSAIRNGISG